MVKGKVITGIPTNWIEKANRFVGFLDIMGFKDRVAREHTDKIYAMMKRLRDAVELSMAMFGVDHEKGDDSISVTITTYSDSIMIYSRDDSADSAKDFIMAVSSLMDSLLSEQIPHKGAVAFGEMVLDFKKSIFFGQPLIDAYYLHDELNYYGVVCHASIEEHIPDEFKGFWLHRYLCPLKKGKAEHLTLFPWSMTLDKGDRIIDDVIKLRRTTSGYLRQYIDNTVTYLQSVSQMVNQPEVSKLSQSTGD